MGRGDGGMPGEQRGRKMAAGCGDTGEITGVTVEGTKQGRRAKFGPPLVCVLTETGWYQAAGRA